MATTQNSHNQASGAPNSSYRMVLEARGSHIAAQVAGTYMVPMGNPLVVSGGGVLYPLASINIVGADWPTVANLTTKLRVRMTVHTNAAAPVCNFTMGLYPLTTGGGLAGLKIFTVGALVTGSGSGTVTAPALSTSTVATGADFALPADGLYGLAVVTSAAIATSSLVQINGILQMRNA
jgi:hypothetical protein